MRTEFALAALGFVSVIFLSSIVSNRGPASLYNAFYGPYDHKRILLYSVSGSVEAGNFSYWKLHEQGPLVLQLRSLSGDADLYVWEGERPGWEPHRNNLSSASCGLDVVTLPPHFPRPLGIGVFGHWSHDVSEYQLNAYLDTEGLHEFIISSADLSTDFGTDEASTEDEGSVGASDQRQQSERAPARPRLYRLFDAWKRHVAKNMEQLRGVIEFFDLFV